MEEKDINKVLMYQQEQLTKIHFKPFLIDASISTTESTLISLGYGKEVSVVKKELESESKVWKPRTKLVLDDWNVLCKEADIALNGGCYTIYDLFTSDEIDENKAYINKLNKDFDAKHKLDSVDITISAIAGIVSAVADILLVGIPARSFNGTNAGALANWVRDFFENRFPPKEMEALGRKSFVKTPYDAQDNRHTKVHIEGLSSYYHRLLSVGHDPILGFIVGVLDIMRGSMTTIDKSGKIVSQVMDVYLERKETTIFDAIVKQILHLKSDLTTTQGLPAPLMSLFNLCQFGSLGEEKQTVAEIVQGMYYEGYDFIHFCACSIPVMLTEVIVRIGWAFKRYKEGYSIKECIPFSLQCEKKPKLETMLFIAHSSATAINAGKVAITKNPMAINVSQWFAFGKYAFQELKWQIYNKPNLRHKYVTEMNDNELVDVLSIIDDDFQELLN